MSKNKWIIMASIQGLLVVMLCAWVLVYQSRINLAFQHRLLCSKYIELADFHIALELRLRRGYARLTNNTLERLSLHKPYHRDLVVDIDFMTVDALYGIGGDGDTDG